MIKASDVVKIGQFYKPHGIAGEITFAFTDDVFDRTESPYWLVEIDGILVPFFLESYRFRSDNTALVKLLDIDDEKEAKIVSDREVFYPKSYAETADEQVSNEDLSWSSYIGYQVIEEKRTQDCGQIEAVDESTINALFLVMKDGKQLIIPANENFIVRRDDEQKIVYMNFPEGLLYLDDVNTENE